MSWEWMCEVNNAILAKSCVCTAVEEKEEIIGVQPKWHHDIHKEKRKKRSKEKRNEWMKGKWEEPWDFTKRSTLQSPVAYHTFIHSNIHTTTHTHIACSAHQQKTWCKKHGIVLYSRQDAHYHYELWELCILSRELNALHCILVCQVSWGDPTSLHNALFCDCVWMRERDELSISWHFVSTLPSFFPHVHITQQ